MKALFCRRCKKPVYEGEKVFMPSKGFNPGLSVKYCYCHNCAKRRRWKVNYIAVFNEQRKKAASNIHD